MASSRPEPNKHCGLVPNDIRHSIPAYYFEIFEMFDAQLIISWPDIREIATRNEIMITGFYWDLITKHRRLPIFAQIMDEVNSWNDGVFFTAAQMEREGAGKQPLAKELMDQNAEYWSQIADLESLTIDMESYVCEVLAKFNLAFEVKSNEDPFWQSDMERVRLSGVHGLVVNDAQNLLLPEFVRLHQVGYNHTVNYYPKTASLLSLEGGNS